MSGARKDGAVTTDDPLVQCSQCHATGPTTGDVRHEDGCIAHPRSYSVVKVEQRTGEATDGEDWAACAGSGSREFAEPRPSEASSEPTSAEPKEYRPRYFAVTDDDLDAPDGAIVDGYKRVGDTWYRIDDSPDDDEVKIRDLAERIAREPHFFAAVILGYDEAACAVLDEFHSGEMAAKSGVPGQTLRSKAMRKVWVAYKTRCLNGRKP